MARRRDSQARRSRRARVEELESRILLSAELPSVVLAETLAHPEDAQEISEPLFSPEPVTHVAEQHASRHELVFVDAGLEDREALVADLLGQGSDQRTVEVVLLDAERDGLSQISETLARYAADLDAVHVVSHGTSQGIQLGGTWLDQTRLDHEADLVAGWRDALSRDADLLLYGCNLAASSEGKALIEQLAGLTGADVAASTDLTGPTALGGDWDLEHRTGSIESFVIFTARAQQGYGAVLGGTAIWADSGVPAPQTSDFDGASFGPESNSAAVGEWRVIAGAEAPTRDEKIVLGTNAFGNLSGQIWDGSTWTALPGISAGLNVDEWSFDVAYSSQSGDALIVWRSASEIAFATWDGTSLSATMSLPTPIIGTPTHIELAADPNSDEIMVVGSSIGLGGFAMVWDGTNFVDGRLFAEPGSTYATDIDVVYEAQSGHAMVVYGDGNDVHYEIYDGVTWTGGNVSDPSGPSSEVRWTELASDPNSDRIAMVAATDFNTAWLCVWDGNAWQPSVLAANNTLHSDRQNIAVAFESNSGEAIAAYTRFGQNEVRYQRWTPAGGWSGELVGPALSTHPDSFTLDPDPNSDAIMLSVVNLGRDVDFIVWNGDSFGSPNTLEVDAGTNRGQPFLFLWDQGVSANAAPTADASAGAPHVISEGGTLDLDGSASSDPDGSIVSWQWDIGNDGTFEQSGVNASYDWAELNAAGIIDEGTVDVALRVTDDGGLTNTQVFTLTVDNAAPTITATGASSVDVGALYTLNLSAADPGDDTIVGWTINWGDGAIETVTGNPSSVSHVYTQAGFTRNITVSARDEDGSWTNSDLIVGQYINNSDLVYRFDANTGALISTFASSAGDVDRAYYPVVGPDGNFYVSGYDSNNVVRYDSAGNYLGEFILSGSGSPLRPDGLAFGPDGNLYVASYQYDQILRFDSSGAFIDIFGGGGGLDGPTGLAFGPDGDLYVASWNNGRLLKIDGRTGGTATTVIGSGLGSPEQIAFDGAGNLYIATGSGSTVERWDGATLTTYFSSPLLDFATGLTFGPDGWLYVSSYNNDRILRFDGSTTEVFVPSGSGGLDQPEYLSFTPAQQVLVVATAQPPSVTSTVTDEDVQSTSGLVLDRNAANGAEVTHFKITNITNGTLYQNDGLTAINEGDFITFVEGNAGLRFTPAPDYSGPASFDVEASTTGDDTSLSGITTASITVNPANDAPVLTPGAPALTPISEDDTGNAGDLVSSILAGSVTDVDASAAEGIAITGLSGASGVWEYDIGSGFTAVGPVSETSALLLRATDRIRFVPDARNGEIASFDFRAWDQTTGVAGGRVDASLPGGTSAFSIASDTASIVVTDVNDAPVLSTTPTPLLDDVTANAGPPTGAVGTLVSSLIDFPGGGGLDNVTDVDTGAVAGIALMKLDSTNGIWHYSLDDGGTWLLVPNVNAIAALLLAAEPGVRLYFEPTPGFSGTIVDAIEFRAWDGTSGASGGFGDTTPFGGQTAFSTGGDYADITVLAPPSSAPSGSDATVVTDEDVPYVFSVADFGFSDPDGDLLQGVLIETVPALGTLRNGASMLTGGEIVSEADITAGNLVYTPIADANGAPYVSFSFRVQDDSGATGFDTDSTPNTITLDVNPLNDAPVLTPSAPSLPTIDEDALSNAGQLVANLLGASVTDVDSPAVEGIAITALSASNGVWEYSTDGGSV